MLFIVIIIVLYNVLKSQAIGPLCNINFIHDDMLPFKPIRIRGNPKMSFSKKEGNIHIFKQLKLLWMSISANDHCPFNM